MSNTHRQFDSIVNSLNDDFILSNLASILTPKKFNAKLTERINSFNKIFKSSNTRIHNYFMNRNFKNPKAKTPSTYRTLNGDCIQLKKQTYFSILIYLIYLILKLVDVKLLELMK